MRFRNYVLSIAALMALGEPLAFAQSVGDTVVVTGTRTERLLRESPVYTEVITSEQIEKRHARDLKEALQYLPGIQLREIHGKSGYEVWIQGLNADRVLVLIDGLPVSPTTGSSVDVTQLSLLDVARVEVVKGATSAQYGSAAMGGRATHRRHCLGPSLFGRSCWGGRFRAARLSVRGTRGRRPDCWAGHSGHGSKCRGPRCDRKCGREFQRRGDRAGVLVSAFWAAGASGL